MVVEEEEREEGGAGTGVEGQPCQVSRDLWLFS